MSDIRIEVLALMGFTEHEPPGGGEPYWTHESSRDPIYEDPFPASLDAIAALWAVELPGWSWERKRRGDQHPTWEARKVRPDFGEREICIPDTGSELTDRQALFLAALKAEKGRKV